ncbi:MAG: protein kinase domain-containing protein [Burkholderiales bacterium]
MNSTDYPPHRSGSLAASATSLKSVDIPLECVPGPGSKAAGLPEKIGKYRVLDQIGTGSTSDVFLCHDDFQDRTVAIKRIKPALPGDGPHSGVHSFAAEAALVGKLNHPYVVKLLDAVDDRAGPYLVMEYVAGSTLRAHCRPDQLLPLEQIMELSFKCAMALNYVYHQGLIHRDVKPANLLTVMRNGQITDIKISDFGSVLNLSTEATQVYRVGSLAYMSPEQLDGAELDCRADMYSLAAVMYHLIAGRPPFDAQAHSALMNQIFHAKAPALTALRPGLSPAVDEFIQRALSKTPGARYSSWEQFARSLTQLVTDQAVPRSSGQVVLESERFNLLRQLDFFSHFGDVELWEVVHRAKWERFPVGHALYKKGEEGRSFHIIATGMVEVFREGKKVAELGAGTSVGEMAYLAPSPDLRYHSADVMVTEAATTISFHPETLAQVNPGCRHLFDKAFIRVLVRRLHAAHEALAHPRRIL